MAARLLALCVIACLHTGGVAASAPVAYKIVDGFRTRHLHPDRRDLAKFVAPTANIQLEALPSAGSAGKRAAAALRSRGSSSLSFNRTCIKLSSTWRRPATPRRVK
jgi:hypothetical protein